MAVTEMVLLGLSAFITLRGIFVQYLIQTKFGPHDQPVAKALSVCNILTFSLHHLFVLGIGERTDAFSSIQLWMWFSFFLIFALMQFIPVKKASYTPRHPAAGI